MAKQHVYCCIKSILIDQKMIFSHLFDVQLIFWAFVQVHRNLLSFEAIIAFGHKKNPSHRRHNLVGQHYPRVRMDPICKGKISVLSVTRKCVGNWMWKLKKYFFLNKVQAFEYLGFAGDILFLSPHPKTVQININRMTQKSKVNSFKNFLWW